MGRRLSASALRALPAAALVLAPTLPAAGQEAPGTVPLERAVSGIPSLAPDAELDPGVAARTAAEIAGMPVYGEDGAVVGEVEAVVRSAGLLFVRIAFADGLGFGQETVPVPLTRLRATADGRLLFPGIEADELARYGAEERAFVPVEDGAPVGELATGG